MTQSGTERFDTLVAPHLGVLYRVAYKLLRNSHDAQDLVQDTCVAACEHPAQVEAAQRPLCWLLRVMHNRFIDGTRRGGGSPFVELSEAAATELLSSGPTPEELHQQAESERALEQSFLRLEPVQRVLLTLRAEGYGLPEIEAITGIGREVLRARLHRARRSLAQYLNETRAETELSRAGSVT